MPMTIKVDLGPRSYPIHIGTDLLAHAGEIIAPLGGSARLALVTDEHVAAHHLARTLDALQAAGRQVDPIILPPGEGTKSWGHLEKLCDRLLALGVERGDLIMALGGGVIGDLAGFAAAILRRGCRFVQAPTTLLSQVDSSVGGKTAIDVAAGKNLIGAFHQPSAVIIDLTCLDSLPDREMRAGYVELVKAGLIGDAPFFQWCQDNAPALLARDAKALAYGVHKAVAFKADVVTADERDLSGRRALLNLGHSFGHALEAEIGYCDALLHGEAVAIGMVLAFRFSAERGLCTPDDARCVADHLAQLGLPVHPRAIFPDAPTASLASALARHMLQDKKMQDGQIRLVLTRGIGRAFWDDGVGLAALEDFWTRSLAQGPDHLAPTV